MVSTAPSTTTIPGQAPQPENGASGDTYTVRSGDTVSGIARRHGVTAEDIASHNGWRDGVNHLIYPGMEIEIPPFAEEASEELDDGRPSIGDALDSLPDIEPNGAPLCPDGTQREVYEVESGDFPNRVATELEIPLEDLGAANASNPVWSSFIIGENLWLPCDGEDLSTISTATETT